MSPENNITETIVKDIEKLGQTHTLENLDRSNNVNSNNVNSNNIIVQKDSNLLKGSFIIIFTLLILILLFFILAYMNGGDVVTK